MIENWLLQKIRRMLKYIILAKRLNLIWMILVQSNQ